MAFEKITGLLSAAFGRGKGYTTVEHHYDDVQSDVAFQDRHDSSRPYPGSASLPNAAPLKSYDEDDIVGMPTHLPGFNKV